MSYFNVPNFSKIVLRATHATPTTIVLRDTPAPHHSSHRFPSAADVRLGTVFGPGQFEQQSYETGSLVAGGGSPVFPAVGDVDAGTNYGPTGTEYTGTLVQPAVGDVDAGVTYGASGTEFTGTLVQPDVADVRSGTTYGAGGTEFTGTLVPGSGGSATARRGILI